MKECKFDKVSRVLEIYSKLTNGETVRKNEEAINYGVDERTIQRDIEGIRNFFSLRCSNIWNNKFHSI